MPFQLFYNNKATAKSLLAKLPPDQAPYTETYVIEAGCTNQTGKPRECYPGLDLALELAQLGFPVIVTGYIPWNLARTDGRIKLLSKIPYAAFLAAEFSPDDLGRICQKVQGAISSQ
jgi:hypothetical protein